MKTIENSISRYLGFSDEEILSAFKESYKTEVSFEAIRYLNSPKTELIAR